jgi:hypothetical protein
MKKWSKILLAILSIIAIKASTGAAYPIKTEIRDDLVFGLEREYLHPNDKLEGLVIYDNFNQPPSIASRNSLFVSVSPQFIPADLISCNPPLVLTIYNPAAVEDRLSAIVYANLKLKILIEEYKQLQIRADEITKGVTSQRSSPSTESIIGAGYSDTKEHNGASIRQQEESIEQQLRALANSEGGAEVLENATDSPIVAWLTNRTINEQQKAGKSTKEADQDSGQQPVRYSRSGERGVELAPRAFEGDLATSPASRLRPIGGEPRTFWMVRVLFGALEYLNENKIESIICSLILVGLAVLLIGLKPR